MLVFSLHSQALLSSWSSSLPKTTVFKVSPEMRERVDFWVKIYSHYSTTQGVFHLTDQPHKILGEIDLTDIHRSPNLSSTQKKKMIEARVSDAKAQVLKKHKISKVSSVRLQMGLKDRMKKALYISGKYLPDMEKIFKREGLPIELTRLVFVESSFNVHAKSKVGASGLWQIMPSVARPHGYIKPHYDKRNHPMYATRLAARIMRDNYRGLKSWPLAVTAYNHGFTGVKRMMRLSESVRLEDMIMSEKTTRTWGFASKNFYACFLAVLAVERNAQELFGEDLLKAQRLAFKEYKLPEKTAKGEVLKWFDGSVTRLKQMNPHLNWASIRRDKRLPAGIPLIVPEKNFALIEN